MVDIAPGGVGGQATGAGGAFAVELDAGAGIVDKVHALVGKALIGHALPPDTDPEEDILCRSGGEEEGGEAAGGEAEEDQESEEAAGNAADGGLCAFLKEGGAEVLEGDTTKTSVSDVSATMVAALGPAHNFVGLMPSSPRANPSKKSRGRGSEIPSVSEKQLLEGELRAEAPSRGSEAPRSPGPGAGPPPGRGRCSPG